MGKIEYGNSPFSKVHHIGIIVSDADRTAEYYSALGIGPFAPFYIAREEVLIGGKAVNDLNLTIKQAHLGPISVELIQPVGGEGYPWANFLKTRGDGLAHIGFTVTDIQREKRRLVKAGVSIIYQTRYRDGGGAAYFDTGGGGAVFELFQAPPDYVPADLKVPEIPDAPFKNVIRISAVVRNLGASVSYYESLGISPWLKVVPAPAGKSRVAMLGDIAFELIQPFRTDTFNMDFLNSKGEGALYMKSSTEHLDSDAVNLIKKGFPVISRGDSFYHFDTRQYGGVIWGLEKVKIFGKLR